MIFSFSFANNTTLSYLFLLFLIIDFYYLIPQVISQTFNPTAELAVPKGIPTNDQKKKLKHNQWN